MTHAWMKRQLLRGHTVQEGGRFMCAGHTEIPHTPSKTEPRDFISNCHTRIGCPAHKIHHSPLPPLPPRSAVVAGSNARPTKRTHSHHSKILAASILVAYNQYNYKIHKWLDAYKLCCTPAGHKQSNCVRGP